MRTILFPLSIGLLLSVAGCGQSQFEMADVEGTCTCDGVPMPMGMLVFTPVKPPNLTNDKVHELGKPAHGEIQEDGSFVLSTYGNEDGAVVGKHRVWLRMDEYEDEVGLPPCSEAPRDLIVEVPADGVYDLNINLSSNPLAQH
ncbi:MAG: hypothetical protein KDA93_13255 [Planctomycetaceae bacterium]|nr:hypothetical protein [Planctomycetaceae bacterium]